MIWVILIIMLFLHIVDDYYLQGCLASMKQKIWWKEEIKKAISKEFHNNNSDKNYNELYDEWNTLYRNDYKMALFEHAFSWSFVVTSPAIVYMFYTNTYGIYVALYISSILFNTLAHAVIDNEKANKHTISLVTDQLMHICQVCFTWFTLFVMGSAIR